MNKRLLCIALLFFSMYAGKNKKWRLAWDSSEKGCACSTKTQIKKDRDEKWARIKREQQDSSAAALSPKVKKIGDVLRCLKSSHLGKD
jgi:hypothetical protein